MSINLLYIQVSHIPIKIDHPAKVCRMHQLHPSPGMPARKLSYLLSG